MQHAELHGIDLAARLVQVVNAMFDRAIAGDVAAAKLILDRLTDVEPIKIDVQNMSHEERVARLRAILNEAAARSKGAPASVCT